MLFLEVSTGKLGHPPASCPCKRHPSNSARCHPAPCPCFRRCSKHCRLAQCRSAPTPHSRDTAHTQTSSSRHLQPRVAGLVQGSHGRNILAQVHLSQLPPLQEGLPRLLQALQKLLPALTLLPILESLPSELPNIPDQRKKREEERVSKKMGLLLLLLTCWAWWRK